MSLDHIPTYFARNFNRLTTDDFNWSQQILSV